MNVLGEKSGDFVWKIPFVAGQSSYLRTLSSATLGEKIVFELVTHTGYVTLMHAGYRGRKVQQQFAKLHQMLVVLIISLLDSTDPVSIQAHHSLCVQLVQRLPPDKHHVAMLDVALPIIPALDPEPPVAHAELLAPIERAVRQVPAYSGEELRLLNGQLRHERYLRGRNDFRAVPVGKELPRPVDAGPGVVELFGQLVVAALGWQPGYSERVVFAAERAGFGDAGAAGAGYRDGNVRALAECVESVR